MATDFDYDVLYIGAGHATFDGATPLAKTGVRVGVIESDLVGGTCPNRGCNAKITLDEPVKLKRATERLNNILSTVPQINWTANVAHKQAIIDPLPANLTSRLEGAGAQIIHGRAKFQDAHTVIVDGHLSYSRFLFGLLLHSASNAGQ